MITQILESILSKLGESFLSKVVEQTANNANGNLKSIKDFELILETLQKNLKSLSAKASDVEEEIMYVELSRRKKRKREVEEWLEDVHSIEKEVVELGTQAKLEGFIMRLMDGGKVTKLNDEVDKLVLQSQNFGELMLDICGTRGEALLMNGMIGEAFNTNSEIIMKHLESREVSSIGVYGMGGVGKTTLVKHIHNQLLQHHEGRVFWVTVSQESTVTSLQNKIARVFGVDLSAEDNEDIRAARLYGALSKMENSVLILDDVWEKIDLLKVGCPFSVECCRLIITTRSSEVCHGIRCQEVVFVQKLREDEAWKLFTETLGNEIELSPQVEQIAKFVANLYDGLPLGIITVGGSMRGKTSIHSWADALAELKERVVGQDSMGDDEVFKVLKYSFDRLKRNHQSNEFNAFQLCFLYCSLYPEDDVIDREDLVRKFISGGLVDGRKSRREQVHRGHSILDKLVNVCLLETCVDSVEHVCVKMHDLVRGMALKIGEGKYMARSGDRSLRRIPDEQEWTEGLEKVSLMESGIWGIRDGISPNCPKLSTLLLWRNPLEYIPDSFFSKMQGLCTLDLCETDIRMLPYSICDMKSLMALLLWNCSKLENVAYLGNLKALRELNLSGTAIKEVPRGLEELVNLNFLSMDAPQFNMMPRGLLFKLGHLQHVNFPFNKQVPIEELENLKELDEFSGGVKNVKDFNSFIESRERDTFYSIGVGLHTYHYRRGGHFGCYNNELFLSQSNLKDEMVLGQGIEYLTIRECEGLSICFVDDLSRLNNPTCLKRLKISECGGTKWIWRSEQGLPSQFSILEEIVLEKLDDLKGLVQEREIGDAPAALAQVVFFSLRWLHINNCNKVKKMGLPVSGVPNLESITILSCGEIEEIFEDEERGPITLHKLKRLSLYELPRLKNVYKATMICNSIKGIYIGKCPRLTKKLPLHLDDPLPPTLAQISVEREWWESLEWENPNLPQLLRPFLDSED